jgi:pilus assembly protein CpaE
MASAKPTVVLIGAREEAATVRSHLAEDAQLLVSEPEPALGLAAVEERKPDLAFLFLDHDPEAILGLAKQVSALGACTVVVVSRDKNPDNILVAMRSGARDFAYLDEGGEDLRRTIRDLGVVERQAGGEARGKIVTVFGAKGGSGATTIAANLAGALCRHAGGDEPAKVVLIDFNLEMGDVLVCLDMTAPYSFQELLANMHRLDADLLYGSLAAHSSGVRVLSQTDHLEEGRELSTADAARILSFLRQHFDFIVIDGVRDFRELALLALDKADTVLLTMTQDIPALKNANRCLRIFKRLGYSDDRVKLVLNRFRRTGQITPDAIADALGRSVSATVSNDFPVVIKAVNEGKLVVDASPTSRVAKDIVDMVGLLHQAAAPRKRGLFSRWGRG